MENVVRVRGMTEARACIVAMFAALALFVSFIVGTCCIHDLGVMRRKLESMGASLAEMQRALDFLAEARPGDTYRIERYAIDDGAWPYEMSRYKDVHEKRVITLYAVHNGNGAYWFTTTTGEAIEADTLIKWERLPKQGELFA